MRCEYEAVGTLLAREEARYVIPASQKTDVERILLESGGKPEPFSNPINRTIYFDTPDHQVPWGCSLRARSYQPGRSLSAGQKLDPNEEYFVETKRAVGSFNSKDRVRTKLKDAGSLLTREITSQTDIQIRPLVAVEYERRHFNLSSDQRRVTLDVCPTYLAVSDSGELTKLGDEEVVILETKSSARDDPKVGVLLDKLSELDIFEVISKKIAGFSLYGWAHQATDSRPLVKELKELEIEAKLLVTDQDPFAFFTELVGLFRRKPGRFAINDVYPFIVASGSVNSYYAGENTSADNEGVKILARPTIAKAVLKSEVRPVTDPHGLTNILWRREIQTPYFPLRRQDINQILELRGREIGEKLGFVGSLKRLRKAFWVGNNDTGRFYHVSLDRCQKGDGRLYEIEIEYTGTREQQTTDPEEAAIRDIADITKIIVEQYPNRVKLEPLCKLDWLLAQKQRNRQD